MTVTIAVCHLKGGSTKTTSTGFLAAALHESGLSVLGVDADGENQSLGGWQELGDLPWPVMTLKSSVLHKNLPELAGDRYDAILIDTPPMQAQRGTVISAMRAADVVVVPMCPNALEYDRLADVLALLEEVGPLRPSGQAPPMAVLLTRCFPPSESSAAADYREQITKDGIRVLEAQLPNRVRYQQAWGLPIRHALRTPYGAAAAELLGLEFDPADVDADEEVAS